MRKQKVLIESEQVVNGGVENFLQNLAVYLQKKDGGRKYDVTVAACPKKKEDFQIAFPSGIRCIQREKIRKKYRRLSPLWIIDKFICKAYDFFINAYLNLMCFDVSIAVTTGRIMKRNARLHAKHKFGWVHMDYSAAALWEVPGVYSSREEERRCMARFEKIVCVSQAALNGLLKTVGDPGNLCVKYNPIDVDKICRMAQEPAEMKKTPGKFLLVSVGRLVPEKQYRLLFEVCASLSKSFDFELWVLGEGRDRSNLEAFIEQEHLTNIKLLGNQKNPYMYLKQADLFVSSSATESYGLAIQEALVLGIPAAAIRCDGIEEAFDPRFGVLTDNNAKSLEDALRSLLEDQENLRVYQENIRRFYPKDSLYEKRMEDICALWESNESNN